MSGWKRIGPHGAMLFEPKVGSVKNIHVASDAELDIAKIAQGAADTVARTEGADTAPEWGKVKNAMVDFLWSTYTPLFSADGGSPSVGNGSIAGNYILLGKFLVYAIEFVPGSTTNFGTGTMHFSMPVSGVAGWTMPLGVAQCYDVSTNNLLQPLVHQSPNTLYCHMQYPGATNNVGALTTVTSTQPWTWTTGDVIRITGMIKAA